MGWFDTQSSVSSSHSGRKRSPSRRSTYSTHHSRHSAPSIFSFNGGGSRSRAGRSSPSAYSSSSRRARPRSGFVQKVVHIIKRLLRDIYKYAREHPIKVLLLVLIPLLTSGVLQKLFAMIGIRLPKNIFGGQGGQSRDGGKKGIVEHLNSFMSIAKMIM
ncbi:oxidase [Aspergillus flavus]|nr:oxidase [Aspergillus flavus]